MLEQIEQLAQEIEGTEGTAESLVAADAILHAEGKFTPDIAMGERPMRSSSLSLYSSVPGKRSAKMSFKVELKGSGAAGTPPEYGDLLRACGMLETTVVGTSVTYTPASDSIPSVTLGLYQDGMISKMWGARGTFRIMLENGGPGWIEFEFTGADFSVTDGALLAGVSYDSTVAPAFLSASYTIDSYAALIEKMNIDVANKLFLRPDINQSSGHLSAEISRRDPVMSFDPEKVLVATYDFFGKMRSGNEGALTATIGATAGNICTITAPAVQYTKIDDTAKEGVRNLGIDSRLNRSSGDDEMSIAFT